MKPVAESVMAATCKLVQQAMSGQWQDVPKTVEERRVMLDRLAASASPQDQEWLGALRSAMAESDRAVARMAGVASTGAAALTPTPALPRIAGEGGQNSPGDGTAGCVANILESTMERLARGR